MTRVKVCGVRDAGTARTAAAAGADFIGVIFARSRRRVPPGEARAIVEAVREAGGRTRSARITGPAKGANGAGWFAAWNEAIEDALARAGPLAVGVFADQTAEEVNAIAEETGIDLIQLSGGEDGAFVRLMRRPALRTVHVRPRTAAADVLAAAVPGAGAGIHLDTDGGAARGGTGVPFDWSVAAEAGRALPVMLAGGLTPENVADAIAAARPWAVDVSSGVETDGAKDAGKVRAFLRAAR